MDTAIILKLIDVAVLALQANMNAKSARRVSDIISERIAENRDWTDAEKQEITDSLEASKAYARAELDKPDPA